MRRVATTIIAVALAAACDQSAKTEPSAEPVEKKEPTAEPEKKPEPTAEKKDEPAGKPADPADEPKDDGDKKAATAKVEPKTAVKGATAEAKPEKEAKPTKGKVVTDAPFAVWLQSSGKYKKGQTGTVTAVLKANDPFKCNEKYPYKFKLDAPPAGVSYANSVVRNMSVSPKQSTMSIPFTANEAGAKTISGQLSFSVCTDAKCLVEKRNLSVSVKVE